MLMLEQEGITRYSLSDNYGELGLAVETPFAGQEVKEMVAVC